MSHDLDLLFMVHWLHQNFMSSSFSQYLPTAEQAYSVLIFIIGCPCQPDIIYVIKQFHISWFTNFVILFWLRPLLLEITYDRKVIRCTKVNMYHGNHFTNLLLNILMHKNSLWSVFHPLVQAGETFIASSFCWDKRAKRGRKAKFPGYILVVFLFFIRF